MHEGKKLFQCELCPKGFGQKSNLETHIEYCHQLKEEICQVCGDDFKTKNVLLKHQIRRHVPTIEKMYHCEQCSQQFVGLISYRSHIREVHDRMPSKMPKKYICPICSEEIFCTNRGEKLENHIKGKFLDVKPQSKYPILHFALFWWYGISVFGPVMKNKFWADYEQLLSLDFWEPSFFMFSGAILSFKYCSVRTKKLHKIKFNFFLNS